VALDAANLLDRAAAINGSGSVSILVTGGGLIGTGVGGRRQRLAVTYVGRVMVWTASNPSKRGGPW